MGLSRRSFGMAVVLAVFAVFWLFRSGDPRAARPTTGEGIIAFGDSLVEGRGATPGHDFVSVLSRRLGVPIINAGRSGDTAGAALSRLDHAVLARSPRVVIVLLGGNDFLRRVPREETFGHLATIVERIRERGAAVVLVGVSVGFFSDSYAKEYEALARRSSAGLVPDILDGIIGHGDRMSDAIHPNDLGHQMIADRLEPTLRDLMRAD
jgi:lysophospholipase L1-like esterase